MESFFSPYVRVGRCPAAVLCRAVIRRRSRRQEAGGSPAHKHCAARTLLLAPAAAGTGRGDHEDDADTGGEAGGGHPGLPGQHGQRRGQHHRGRK